MAMAILRSYKLSRFIIKTFGVIPGEIPKTN
jgi:hypothetical protein